MAINDIGLTPATKILLNNRKLAPRDRAFNELLPDPNSRTEFLLQLIKEMRDGDRV